MGKSTEYAGEGARGVSPPGVEGNGESTGSLFILGSAAAGVVGRSVCSVGASRARERVLGRSVVIVIEEASRSRTTGRPNLSSRIVDGEEYRVSLLKVKKYVAAVRSKRFQRRHKWDRIQTLE